MDVYVVTFTYHNLQGEFDDTANWRSKASRTHQFWSL